MEFINNAKDLEKYTLTHTRKFPKRYTFTLTNEIVGYSREIYNIVSSANNYPKTIEDYELRRRKFNRVKELLGNMSNQLQIAEEMFILKLSVLKEWAALICKEEKLINGILSSDRSAIKELQGTESK